MVQRKNKKDIELDVEKIKYEIEESFFEKDGKTFTSLMNLIICPEIGDLVRQYFYDILENGSLRIYYDSTTRNNDSIFLVYKNENKLVFDYLFNDEIKNKFVIEIEDVWYSFPNEEKLSDISKNDLAIKLKDYQKKDDNIIIDKTKYANYVKFKQFSNDEKKEICIGLFWRYGIILCVPLLCLISFLIIRFCEVSSLVKRYLFCGSLGIPMIIMGIDYILACIFKWKHILLVNQSCYHAKMNPRTASWGDISIKEFIAVGILFLIFGLAMFVVPLLDK